MINIVIFSKDRACQLDLFARSFSKHFRGDMDDNINVIYTYSDDKYKEGYDLFLGKNYGISMISEDGGSFKHLTESAIDPELPYTLFFVDDNILKENFDVGCSEMKIFEDNPDILCLSLRLYSGINYCYTIPCESPAPNLGTANTWEWEGQPGDWGYPMSLDGHIFRTQEILDIMKGLDYKSPNTLEGHLANQPIKRPKMICLDNSVVVNNPCNKVQVDNGNHCGNVEAEFLNTMYLVNRQISLCNIEGIVNNAPHQEIDVIIEEAK
jgi:hypothetical protein